MPERAVNKDAAAKVTSLAPDVCLTPMGSSMVPVPYTITAHFNVAESIAPKVNYGGLPAFTMASRLPRVEGDEQGTGGGIISKVNLGYCRPVEHSGTVKAHKQYVVRQGDLMHMNCNGPDGPANTFGRIEYIGTGTAGEVSRETISKSSRITVDSKSGKTIVEERESSRDPKTGSIKETAQRTEIDSGTGEIKTQSVSITTEPGGARAYETTAGHFDPANKSFTLQTSSGDLPQVDIGSTGPVLGNDAIGTIQDDGRMYLGDGVYAHPGAAEPTDNIDITDNDPELLSDPEYQEALEEQAKAQAEIDATNEELKWEAAKTAVDAAGLVDPTPISDAVGAGMALRDGDWAGFGLSIVSMVPYLGDAIGKTGKGARTAARVAKLLQKLEKAKDKLKKLKDLAQRAKDKVKNALKRKRGGSPDAPTPNKPNNPGDGGHVPQKPALRLKYEEEVRALAKRAEELRKQGKSAEEIARELHAKRRALGEKYKSLTPPEKLAEIYERNLKRYGDKLGPSIDWLRKQGKSWDDIIESASRSGGKDLGF